MLKRSSSVLAKAPVADDAAEEDVFVVEKVEALLVVLVVVTDVVFTVELDETDVTMVVSAFAK